jgi:hypothetical protein
MREDFFSLKTTAYIFLSMSFVFFAYVIFNFYGSENYAGDGLRHYIVSRWCWNHHDLLLYHWGKPFFTIISSPFSQFGLKGIQFFNLLVSAGGAWLLYRFSKEVGVENSSVVILFVFFATGYFLTINTGLTEPLFFFMIAVPAFLFYKEKYLWSCILLSFLPYVRSEGNIIIMLFVLVLAWRGKWKYIPFLALGTIVYSIIGGFYYKDLLWIWTKNPYDGTNRDFYGSGELLHFVKNYQYVLGIPLSFTFILGLIFYIAELVKKGFKRFIKEYDIEVLILLGSFVVYFIAHSIFWWKGLFNSLGLIRAIAGVIPLSTVCCLRGLNFILSFIKIERIKTGFVLLFATLVIAYPFLLKKFPFVLDAEDKVSEEAIKWFTNSPFKNKLVFYLNPYFADRLDRDPFDDKKMRELWGLLPSIKEWGHTAIPDSTIIFWDAHYGPNECRVPLDSMRLNPYFQLIESFKPEQNFQTLGGYDYAIYAYAKTTSHKLVAADSIAYDFEENSDLENTTTITDAKSSSGRRSCQLDDKHEYSATIAKKVDDFTGNKDVRGFKITFHVFAQQVLNGAKFVFSISDANGKDIEWEGKELVVDAKELNSWATKEINFGFSGGIYKNSNCKIKIYVWNSAHELFWVDDFKITIMN